MNRSKCPICSGNKVILENSILITHLDVCKEWNYELNELGPENYSYGSKYEVFLNCPINTYHKYRASIYSIIGDKSGCTKCNKFHGQKILIELEIKYISQWNPFVQLGRKAYDFIIPDYKVTI